MSAVAEDIRSRLGAGERVLWSGRPRQGVVLRGTDALAIPFSLLWGGFAFFWEWGVIHSDAPLFFSLWGIPFVLVGIYLIAGRFFVEARQREKTSYAVTNERILIVAGLLRPTIKSLSLNTLTDVSLTENANGTGTITFGPASALSSMSWGNSWWPGAGTQMGPRFDLVPDAKKVYDTIRTAQKAQA